MKNNPVPYAKYEGWLLFAIIVLLLVGSVVLLLRNYFHPQSVAAPNVTIPESSRGKQLSFLFARGADSQKLDPADIEDGESVKVLNNICEGLVRFKAGSTEVEPCLAESWWSGPDGMTFGFTLRKGVRFHDGTELTGEAVAWNFNRMVDPKHPAHFATAKFSYADFYKLIEKIEVSATRVQNPNPVVVFRLKHPDPAFLQNLAMFPAYLISPKSFEKYREGLQRHPVGTGPFKFVEWQPNERIVLEANKDYWGEKPSVDRLIFKVAPDSAQRLIQLQAGQITGMDGVDPNDLEIIKRDTNLKLVAGAGLNISYLAFQCEKPPLNDPRFRRAVALAIDRETLLAAVYRGAAVKANSFMPPMVAGYHDALPPLERDVAAAKKLLDEVPNARAKPIKLAVMTNPRPYLSNPIRAAELIKEDLRQIGLEIQIVPQEWGTHLAATRNGEHELALLGWVGDNGDADNFLCIVNPRYATKGSAINISFYQNADLLRVFDDAAKELDPQKRVGLYRRAQELLREAMPVVPLAHAQDMVALRKNIEGFTLQPNGDLIFSRVWWGR